MKTIVHKGIAGLGNRFSVLGYCYDLALKYDARLLVDWRDSSWRDDSSKYFNIKTDMIKDFREAEYPNVQPSWWEGDKINCKCVKRLAGEGFARVDQGIIASGWDTLVVCQYLGNYSDEIFKAVDFSEKIKELFSICQFMIHGNYECWHIRNTDKRGDDPDKMIGEIIDYKTPFKKVLLTDHFETKEKAIENGIFCFSVALHSPSRKGIHHFNDKQLEKASLNKQDINENALLDVLIGSEAVKFHETCQKSSYSRLIKRIRKFKGKDK